MTTAKHPAKPVDARLAAALKRNLARRKDAARKPPAGESRKDEGH
jgi:hypothetical protein